jgi:CBS domain-containing protein
MVKSYQAPKKKRPKFKNQATQVKDFMTKKLITFSPDDSMGQVLHTLVKHGFSGGPVVNDEGELVGIVSEGDCVKQVVRGKYTNTPELNGIVSEYMTPDPITVSSNENIIDVAQKFLKLRLRRFPVVDNGKLVGQISQYDVMVAVDSLRNETWS